MRSFRDAILETIRLTLLDMKAGQDQYSYQFSEVTRADALAPASTKRFMGNVQPGDEVKSMDIRFVHCQLAVIVDFAFTVNAGDPKPAELVEVLLSDVQRWLYRDRTLNNLAIDMREEGNSVTLTSSVDKLVEGTLFLNVHYRHDLDNPCLLGGEPPEEPRPTQGAAP